MDWSRIKSIFLVTFLALNLFLAYQLISKISGSNLDSSPESTIEEQLAANEISYSPLPKQFSKESYISGERHHFSLEEVKELNKSKFQVAEIQNENTLYSVLTKPIPLKTASISQQMQEFVSQHIWNGQLYKYWGIDYDKREIYFYQSFYDRQIYSNPNAMVVFYFDDKNQVYGYKQTFLEDLSNIVPKAERVEITSPIRAIELLYNRNVLEPGSNISKVELGYYSLAPLPEGVQVIVPTWYIQVGKDKHYFVNAIEEQIFQEETQWSE